LRLERRFIEPGFTDPRHCLVVWARPPDHVVKLAVQLQSMLKEAAPGKWSSLNLSEIRGLLSFELTNDLIIEIVDLWLMPPHRMHMTALEVTHSRTPTEIDALVTVMRGHLAGITSYTHAHRARLVKPMLSYDLAAIAVSFLPAAGEKVLSPRPVPPEPDDRGTRNDEYTYHHLRRDLFDLARASGVRIDSRYVVPSAHITLGRYLGQDDHATPEARASWIEKIDKINDWLKREVWGRIDGDYTGEWIVGQERGLDARSGPLWYGGGRTIVMGEGF